MTWGLRSETPFPVPRRKDFSRDPFRPFRGGHVTVLIGFYSSDTRHSPIRVHESRSRSVLLTVVIPAIFADPSVILFLFSQPVNRGDLSTYYVPEAKGISLPSSELTAW